MLSEAAARAEAEALTTAERVALLGPRRFDDQFRRSAAAQGLLAKGLIDMPAEKGAAPLTNDGVLVRAQAEMIAKRRRT